VAEISPHQVADVLQHTTQLALRPQTTAEPADNRLRADRSELAWLTRLPGSVMPHADETGVQSVAERILPRLRELIRARALVLMEDRFQPQSDSSFARLLWSGGETVRSPFIERMIRRHAPEALSEDGVCLDFTIPSHSDGTRDGIFSAILMPVRWLGTSQGWLVAVNKDLRRLATGEVAGRYGSEIQPADVEFGEAELNLMSAASSALATNNGIRELLSDRERLLAGVVRTIVNALDAKDSYTCGHSERVAEFARLTAEAMGVPEKECEQIHMAGLLHDIGKIGIPDRILNKTSAVTEQEMECVRRHPVIGYEILQHLSSFEYVLPGVLHHHESFDGTGYPHGLSGSSIPLSARILAVADAWDAMTSDRPYRVGMEPDCATSILNEASGQQWDPRCVAAFLQCMDAVRVRMDLAHSGPEPPLMIRSAAIASMSNWPQPAADTRQSSH
jgi:HD-GYP domain-containing protein (c-di-GMP phosphodiesterase class II)